MMVAAAAAADIARYCAGVLFFCSVRAGEEAAQDRRRAKQAAQAAQAEIRHQRQMRITMLLETTARLDQATLAETASGKEGAAAPLVQEAKKEVVVVRETTEQQVLQMLADLAQR